MDNRRQSGLWAQNPATGFYEQQQPVASALQGPYQYYQPPPRRSDSDKRRSTFSERVGDATSNALENSTGGGGGGGDSQPVRSLPQQHSQGPNTTRAMDENKIRQLTQAASAKVAGMSEMGHMTTSQDLAGRRHVNDLHAPSASYNAATRQTGGSNQQPLRVNPDAVPENLRNKPWSPDPTSPQTQLTAKPKTRQPSNASEHVRRGSVSNRSPLQKLEGQLDDIGKKEKRARAEEAEYRARQKSVGMTVMPTEGDMLRAGTLRSEKGRVVSDGSRRPSEPSTNVNTTGVSRQVSDGSRRSIDPGANAGNTFRQVSAGAPMALPPDNGNARFKRASDQLKNGALNSHSAKQDQYMPSREDSTRFQQQTPPIVKAPQPYHHAPEAPRSLGIGRKPGTQPIESAPRPYHHAPEQPRSMDAGARPDAGVKDAGIRPIERVARPYHHAPEEPRSLHARMGQIDGTAGADGDGLNRSASGKYQHRLRDAGFAGAGAAIAGGGVAAYEASAADRGKAAYERRRSQDVGSSEGGSAAVGRSGSRKLQKPYPADYGKQQLQQDRMGSNRDHAVSSALNGPDPVTRESVATGGPVSYAIPPQTAAGQDAREQVGFNPAQNGQDQRQQGYGADTGNGLYANGQLDGTPQQGRIQPSQPPLEEWRNAKIGRLSAQDLEMDGGSDDAWWEKNQTRRSSGSSRQPSVGAAQLDGPYEEEAKLFRPPLFLKCGPLLRYTGIRREQASRGGEREIWRGSLMIVTEDGNSDYSAAPTLRLFAQPMDLHQPPTREMLESGQAIPPEYEDPVAGQVKVSRTGRPLYVRPAADLPGEVDLSLQEDNQGLYAAQRTGLLGPSGAAPEGRQSPHVSFQDKSRIKRRDGEKAGRYQDISAVRLHTERGFTFWRWSVEVELGSTQHRVAYRINKGPALGFWVPARGASMNIMFHSCNGFSRSVDPNIFSGPDPLWRDVLNRHQSRPFHVMIGGGDQIYNDRAMDETELFREWLQVKNPHHKHGTPFSPEMKDELEEFYLHRYAMWFSQGLFAMAASQVPMVNLWDDHDIIDGFGSYPHHFMATPVFAGLGAVAFKYYMLFQHQSVVAETAVEEPSWILGASPGPYVNELSRHIFMNLGRKVAFLGLDCRTERMRDEILSQESYDLVFDRARSEIRKGETKHLIVLLGVPIAYPRLNFLENILTSRAMDPIKAIGRTGMLGGFVNKFDGGVEILDDLDDHWTAKHHKAERNWFVQELQELAAEKSVRVTILGGDVHLGAVGQFYTPRKFGVPKDRDHRYMPNVVSSAIVNTPPPPMMADVLNRRNKVHHLDDRTDEDLIPMFEADVDGSKRRNRCLLPRRNYCTIREFEGEMMAEGGGGGGGGGGAFGGEAEDSRRFPPGSMRGRGTGRTMSLTRGPIGGLVRRLSGSGRYDNAPPPNQQGAATGMGMGRSNSSTGPDPRRQSFDAGDDAPPPQRPGFHRRPTNLTPKEIRKAAAKGGAPEEGEESGVGGGAVASPGDINLEGGLDISLNMEIDQRDPGGQTERYRLLVPALWYEGPPDMNDTPFGGKVGGLMDRFRSKGRRGQDYGEEDEEYYSADEGEGQDEGDEPWKKFGAPGPPTTKREQQQANVMGASIAAARMPPTQQQPRQQQKYVDGAYEDPRSGGVTAPSAGNRASMQPASQPAPSAYSKGYNLSQPPLGPGSEGRIYNKHPYPRTDQNPYKPGPPKLNTRDSNPYPPTQPANFRRMSAPTSPQKHTQRGGPDEYSEGSLTPSEEYEQDAFQGGGQGGGGGGGGMQPRRLSKAERFFGIGDDGRRASLQEGRNGGGGFVGSGDGGVGGYGEMEARRKPKWKVWR